MGIIDLNLGIALGMPNKIDTEGCRKLSVMKTLRKLNLDGNGVNDSGVGFLSLLASLEELSLENPNSEGATEVGASYLTNLRNLRTLKLSNSILTQETIKLETEEPKTYRRLHPCGNSASVSKQLTQITPTLEWMELLP